MLRRIVLGLVFGQMFGFYAYAKSTKWTIESEKSPVSFLAIGKPGFLKIKGEGASLEGVATFADGVLQGDFTVNLSNLKTGIDMRDSHMKDRYLEIGKFPTANLKLNPTSISSGKDSYDGEFNGQISIKGVAKEIKGKLSVSGLNQSHANGNAEFEISVDDFPIGTPSHFGVTVAKTVKVTVEFNAQAAEVATPKNQ